MDRVVIESFDIKFKSALRNLNFAILCALLLALCFSVEAQQPAKIPRLGYVTIGSDPSTSPNLKAFRQGLRTLGYIEGKNIQIESR